MDKNAKTFILNELEEVCKEFPSITAKFKFDADSATYFIEILPKREFNDNRELRKRMSKITKEFVRNFRTESICWLSEDDLVEIENPDLVLNGELHKQGNQLIQRDSIIPSFEQYIPEINEIKLERLTNYSPSLKNVYWENVLSTSFINCTINRMGQTIDGWDRYDFDSWFTFKSDLYTGAQSVFRLDGNNIDKHSVFMDKLFILNRDHEVFIERVNDHFKHNDSIVSFITFEEGIRDQQREESIIDDHFNDQAA